MGGPSVLWNEPMQGRPLGWEIAISLPAGLPLLWRGVNTMAIGHYPRTWGSWFTRCNALIRGHHALFFFCLLNEGNFLGGAKVIFQLDMCHGQGFFPQFCDMENLANFSKTKKITQICTRNFIYPKISQFWFFQKKTNFRKFCLSKKDKICQDKKITPHGDDGKSLLLNPANYTSSLWERILQITLNPLT